MLSNILLSCFRIVISHPKVFEYVFYYYSFQVNNSYSTSTFTVESTRNSSCNDKDVILLLNTDITPYSFSKTYINKEKQANLNRSSFLPPAASFFRHRRPLRQDSHPAGHPHRRLTSLSDLTISRISSSCTHMYRVSRSLS